MPFQHARTATGSNQLSVARAGKSGLSCPCANSGLARDASGGDMSTPQKHPPTRHYLQTTSDNRRYALPEPCVFNRSAALRCDIRRACRGKRSALGPALGIPRTRQMGQSLRMTRPRVLGHPSDLRDRALPPQNGLSRGDPTACGNKDSAFWSRMIASVTRPSGVLRCSDLPCQFRLTGQGCQS